MTVVQSVKKSPVYMRPEGALPVLRPIKPPLQWVQGSCDVSRSYVGDVKSTVFWHVMPCNLVDRYQRFGEPYCLHIHNRSHVSTELQGVTSQKTFNTQRRGFSRRVKQSGREADDSPSSDVDVKCETISPLSHTS
jgi:hypothetical protein